jgi:hypothetical protein
VFGQVDLPYSVLDYLGLARRADRGGRRSIFRRYASERPMLFESCYSERKGLVQRLLDGGRVEELASANGELFSPRYSRRLLAGEEARSASQRLAGLQAQADSSLLDSDRKDRRYVLLKDEDFRLARGQSKILSWGQYLQIPGETTVEVELRAAARLEKPPANGAKAPACLQLFLVPMRENQKLPLPALRLPALKPGQSLDLAFSFPVEQSLDRIWAYLEAEAVHPSAAVGLRIKRLTVEIRARDADRPYQVRRLVVRGP